MNEPTPRKAPVLIEIDEPALSPAEAPPVPEPDLPEGRVMQGAALLALRRPSRLWRFAFWAMGGLLSFVLTVAIWDFVTALLARNTVLGAMAIGLTGLVLIALAALSLREALTFWRLARLDHLRTEVAAARQAADLSAARAALSHVERLYAGRADQRWSLARLRERRDELMDADALLDLGEAELMAGPDQAARRQIEAATRRVATVTALVPLALADLITALFANLAMIRAIATIYGGRSGTFGSLKLLRRVFAHLMATGALAIGDDLIGSVAGGGLLGKLSRRFGEGVVNGALTARVGVAAMEVCRPMPFAALPRPGVTNLVTRALGGMFGRDGMKPDADGSDLIDGR